VKKVAHYILDLQTTADDQSSLSTEDKGSFTADTPSGTRDDADFP
jgi:hypothetical protein